MSRLRNQSGRITKSRRTILEALCELQRPATLKELLVALPPGSCDRATVYRSITLFEDKGLVRRIDFGDGATRYEVADVDPHGHHHHHLVCRECGRIVKLDDCELADLEKRLGSRHGFEAITHRLEFFGRCRGCSSGTSRAAPQNTKMK